MMGHKEKIKSATEQDVLCTKHNHCYISNSNVSHKIKKQLSKRMRKLNKKDLKNESENFFFSIENIK